MYKKTNLVSYPAPHVELSSTINDAKAVSAKISRINEVRDQMPSELSQIANAITETEGLIAKKEAELVLSESSELREEVESLTATILRMQSDRNRLTRTSDALNAVGTDLNAELATALAALNLERNKHATNVRYVLAEGIVKKASELAEIYEAYQLFAPVSGTPEDWLQSAYISDPRKSLRLMDSTGAYDQAPNLLKKIGDGSGAEAIKPALVSLETARDLLRTRPYTPRVQHSIKPHSGLRGSSEGPHGLPDVPPEPKQRHKYVQTEVHRPQHLRAGHSPNRG
jgi:hypothetical protein